MVIEVGIGSDGRLLISIYEEISTIIIKLLPYAGCFAGYFCDDVFWLAKQRHSVKAPIAAVFNDASFSVTADQVSESYVVANIANAVSLPSNATISENYATVNAIYESTGTTSTSGTIIEKPTIIDTSNLSRGVITHTVEQDESIDSILKKYNLNGVTKDQVRWSNGMKTEDLTVGQKLLLPSVPGIVYVVKNGDT